MFTGFKEEAFNLLGRYKENNDFTTYSKEEFDPLIRDQFKALRDKIFPLLQKRLPNYGLTQKLALSKHATQGNKLFHHFWAAIYREIQEKKSNDIQLFWRIDVDRFHFGIYVGHRVTRNVLEEIQKRVNTEPDKFVKIFKEIKEPRPLVVQHDDTHGFSLEKLSPEVAFSEDYFLKNNGFNIYFSYSKDETVEKGESLLEEILLGFENLANLYESLVPPVLEQKVSLTPPKLNIEPQKDENQTMKSKVDLNRIFFGPPGTGKTYEVRREALKIILGSEIPSDYKDIVRKFNELKEKGQIEFVTFHPNFGYENFVEGLFPTIKNSKLLTYEVEPGVFKKICDKAEKNLKLSGGSRESDLDQEFEKRWEALVNEIEENEESLDLFTLTEVPFKLRITKTGGTAVENNSGNIHHIAKKRYLSTFIDLSKKGIKNPSRGDIDASSLTTYIAPVMNKIMNYEVSGSGGYEETKNYVLIIDEINRGNIPAIFGELITLIEPSKRVGNEESLRLTLPLSGEDFGVPSNLHILGTMNTADRSVESLDVALRRRFSFEPMYPNPNLSLISELDGINCSELLKSMNKRIKVLKGDDFQIGHSYFIGLEKSSELVGVFTNKIIPLLLEYFFDDLEKIQMILGPSFVKRNPPDENIFASNVFDFDPSETFELRESDHWNFKSIYE
jgi:5-methylcytosine-specific restriction endonuclease McrBC GTP-binding regulatory subunit McrB